MTSNVEAETNRKNVHSYVLFASILESLRLPMFKNTLNSDSLYEHFAKTKQLQLLRSQMAV